MWDVVYTAMMGSGWYHLSTVSEEFKRIIEKPFQTTYLLFPCPPSLWKQLLLKPVPRIPLPRINDIPLNMYSFLSAVNFQSADLEALFLEGLCDELAQGKDRRVSSG